MIEIEVPYSTAESVSAVIETVTDPTGNAVEFQLTAGYAPPAGSGWTAGTWSTSWDSASARATAVSPNIGSDQALALTQGKTFKLWIKFTSGDDVVIRGVATIAAV